MTIIITKKQEIEMRNRNRMFDKHSCMYFYLNIMISILSLSFNNNIDIKYSDYWKIKQIHRIIIKVYVQNIQSIVGISKRKNTQLYNTMSFSFDFNWFTGNIRIVYTYARNHNIKTFELWQF